MKYVNLRVKNYEDSTFYFNIYEDIKIVLNTSKSSYHLYVSTKFISSKNNIKEILDDLSLLGINVKNVEIFSWKTLLQKTTN